MVARFNLKILICSFVVVSLGYGFFQINHRVGKLEKSFKHKLRKHKTTVRANEFVFYKVLHNKFTLPRELRSLPYASPDLVLGVKEVKIRNAFAPYNASIFEKDDGYHIFFRYDRIQQYYYNKIHTYIGWAELDENLNQTDREFVLLNTNSNFSEDPRVLEMGGSLRLVYNDLFQDDSERRGMHMGTIDLNSKQVNNITPIDIGISQIEKNWSPFVIAKEDGREAINFEYQVASPRRILVLDNPEAFSHFDILQHHKKETHPWHKRWGVPLGGTPARLVDGEYLGFFHSKFKDNRGIYWYVMGAYTFETKAPFKITRMSPYPILYKGIYETEYKNTAEPCKCIVFPSGFAVKKKNGQEFIQLACGENDSAIKVITFDKNALLESLVPVNKI